MTYSIDNASLRKRLQVHDHHWFKSENKMPKDGLFCLNNKALFHKKSQARK